MWQMMVALLHSNEQLGSERDGDTEKGCQKPAVQQKTTDDDDDDDDDAMTLLFGQQEGYLACKNCVLVCL